MHFTNRIPLAVLSLALFCLTAVQAQVRSELVTGGLTLPIGIVADPMDATRLFVIEQRSGTTGRIRVVQNGSLLAAPFLSISPVSTGGEQGLLGLAFAPDYASSGFFYVNYTDAAGSTNVVRYTRSAGSAVLAEPNSAHLVLRFAQPFNNHNGGNLIIGSDGLLYIGTGDGGSGNDPGNRAQDTGLHLGKMLRIDPSGDDFPADPDRNFRIPTGNPFVGNASVLPEIWSLGLRNPWRYSQDRASMLGTDAWLIADVGQGAREEINYEFPGQAGRNYGWVPWEGTLATGLGALSAVQPNVTFPVFEYDHSVGQSITGGFVYRGIELGPEFFGKYIYGDFIAGRIWALPLNVNVVNQSVGVGTPQELTQLLGFSGNLSTFGVDTNGELLMASYGNGQVFRIRPKNRVWLTDFAPFNSEVVSGTLRHLVAIDQKALQVKPPVAGSRGQTLNFKGGLTVGFKTDQFTAGSLNVTLRLGVNQTSGGSIRLLLKDWSTGNYVDLGGHTMTAAASTVTFSGIPAGAFRRADGRIEARLTASVSVKNLTPTTMVDFDQVWVTAN